MTKRQHGIWVVKEVEQATVDRCAATHVPDGLASDPGVDIIGDPGRK
jgi:hypothetical protein